MLNYFFIKDDENTLTEEVFISNFMNKYFEYYAIHKIKKRLIKLYADKQVFFHVTFCLFA